MNGPVCDACQFFIVCDNYEGLAELVSQIKEELM